MKPPEKPPHLAALFRPFERPPEAPRAQPKPFVIPNKYPVSTPLIVEAFNTVFNRLYLQLVGLTGQEAGPRLSNQATWPLKLHWVIPPTRDGREACSEFISDIESLAPEVASADTEAGEVTLSFSHPRDALTTLQALIEDKGNYAFATDTLGVKRFEKEEDDALTDDVIAAGKYHFNKAIEKGWDIFSSNTGELLRHMPPTVCNGVWDAFGVAYYNAAHATHPGCALINLKTLENAIAIDTKQITPHPLAALH